MESALLYSFSTISQTLATAFALLAAMVLYRFQTLENGLPKDLEALTNRNWRWNAEDRATS